MKKLQLALFILSCFLYPASLPAKTAIASSDILRSIYRLEVDGLIVGTDADGNRLDIQKPLLSCSAFAIDKNGWLITSDHGTAGDVLFALLRKAGGENFARLASVEYIEFNYVLFDRSDRSWRTVANLCPKMSGVDLGRLEGYRSPVYPEKAALVLVKSDRRFGVTLIKINTSAVPLIPDLALAEMSLDTASPVHIYGYWQQPPWQEMAPRGKIKGICTDDVFINAETATFFHLKISALAKGGSSGGAALQNGKVIGLVNAVSDDERSTSIIPVWDLKDLIYNHTDNGK